MTQKEGRSKGVAPSNREGGGLRQRTRASARRRDTGVWRARALHRGQAMGWVDEAPEESNGTVRAVVTGTSSTRVEGLRQ